MATGIKDKVAIIGMGCSKFGERWDCGTEHLLIEAFQEALQDAGIEKSQIGAAWYGSALDRVNVGNSAIPATTALRLEGIPVTRVENMCATGTEALRGAAYAVAAGAVDYRAGDRRREAQGHRVRRSAGADQGHAQRPDHAVQLGAGRVRAAGGGLSRQVRRVEGGPQARDRSRLVEEPSERRQESQGASAEGSRPRHDPQRADHRGSAGSLRLLRCQRRRRVRDRDDAGDRTRPRQEGPRHDQGAAALAERRSRDRHERTGTAATCATRASQPRRRTRRPASAIRARSSA